MSAAHSNQPPDLVTWPPALDQLAGTRGHPRTPQPDFTTPLPGRQQRICLKQHFRSHAFSELSIVLAPMGCGSSSPKLDVGDRTAPAANDSIKRGVTSAIQTTSPVVARADRLPRKKRPPLDDMLEAAGLEYVMPLGKGEFAPEDSVDDRLSVGFCSTRAPPDHLQRIFQAPRAL